jgi:hypothetical protein
MAVRSSALSANRPLPPGKYLVLISARDWVDSRAILRMEGLGQLKNSNDLIWNRTRDLPACSIVPQLRAPQPVRNNSKQMKKIPWKQSIPDKTLESRPRARGSRLSLNYGQSFCFTPIITLFTVLLYDCIGPIMGPLRILESRKLPAGLTNW